MPTNIETIKSEEIDPYLSDILYSCIIGGWERIESDGSTYVYDEMVVETIKKILENYTENTKLNEIREEAKKELLIELAQKGQLKGR